MDNLIKRDLEEVLKILEEGKKRIQIGFCKFTMARNGNGDPVKSDSKDAKQWCALGAIGEGGTFDARNWARSKARKFLFNKTCSSRGWTLHEFNDHINTSKEDVISLFERTIEDVKKEIEEASL